MRLVAVTHVYEQKVDGCGPTGCETNRLIVRTEDAGGGPYVLISTKSWAFASASEAAEEIEEAVGLALRQIFHQEKAKR